MILCSITLISCNGEVDNGLPTVEYGYKRSSGFKQKYPYYRIAYKVDRIKEDAGNTTDVEIKISHGTSGPMVDGGYFYPEVQCVQLLLDEDVLFEEEYFKYLDYYLYKSATYTDGTDEFKYAYIFGERVKFYTSDYYDDYVTDEIVCDGYPLMPVVIYSNEATYTLPLSEGKDEYTISIREVYFDGTVKTVAEAKLYSHRDGERIYFSTEPFSDTAE